MSVIVVAATAATAGTGVVASFNAESTNTTNTFATGTLTVSDTVNGTTCLSSAGATDNVNAGCQKVIDGTALQYPGSAPVTGAVTIASNGSLPGSALSIYTAGCSDFDVPGKPSQLVTSGSACGSLLFTLQETDGTGHNLQCWYPSGAGTTCSFTAGQTLAGFTAAHLGATNRLSLTPLPAGATGSTRYFTLGFQLPANPDNQVQGRAAQVDFTWHLDQ